MPTSFTRRVPSGATPDATKRITGVPGIDATKRVNGAITQNFTRRIDETVFPGDLLLLEDGSPFLLENGNFLELR